MSIISNQLILDQIPASIAWKDRDLKYIGANQSLIMQLKLTCREELIGISDNEIPSGTPTQNAIYRQHDLLALQGHTIEIIHALPNDINNKTYFLQKSALRDEKNTIIGVLYHCMSWRQDNLLTFLKNFDKQYQTSATLPDFYTLNNLNNPNGLSERELECLFLQLRGKTAQQIGEILNLSKRTVEFYVDNIKSKFGCMNKAELLVKAIGQGYQKHIPKRLINLNLVEVLQP